MSLPGGENRALVLSLVPGRPGLFCLSLFHFLRCAAASSFISFEVCRAHACTGRNITAITSRVGAFFLLPLRLILSNPASITSFMCGWSRAILLPGERRCVLPQPNEQGGSHLLGWRELTLFGNRSSVVIKCLPMSGSCQ